MKQKLLTFAVLALLSSFVLAASVPNTFTASTPAVASQVNANFAALVNAVTTLEQKVAALESTTLTAADVAGTYKYLQFDTYIGSLAAKKTFAARSGVADGTFTFNVDGTFGVTGGTGRSNEFGGKAQDCAETNGPTTSDPATNPHTHGFIASLCNMSGQPFNTRVEDRPGDTSTGTWALGPANTITVTFNGGTAFTVYGSKAGGVGFSIGAEVVTDNPDAPGRQFSLGIFVKQPQ